MTETMTPRDRRSARTVQAILDAGRQIISRDGVDGLSMRALAEAIDYSPAALYKYFGSKEEIIGALCEVGFELFYQHLVRARPEGATASEELFACGLAYVDFAYTHSDYYALMFNTPRAEPASAGFEELNQDTTFGVLLGIIERGVEAGEFNTRAGYGPMVMAMHCWMTVHGIATLTLTQMQAEDEGVRQMTEAILSAMGRGLRSG